MCGISGKICLGKGLVKQSELEEMAGKISYRGPDDQGYYISEDRKVGFSHNRLAILDLSQAGHQPMSYMDKYWIVYNGEIYNFQEEKERLEKSGYKFKSKTDTEVILALYDKYGFDCLKHLRGMFALAIHDKQKNLVFIARDRLGKKPFKYFNNGNVFYFASELKAFLGRPEIKKRPDWISIHHYLTFGYVPEHETGFVGIKKLEPAHYMVVDLASHAVAKYKYWELDFSQKWHLSEEEWIKIIQKELNEAVKIRMIGDVPVGAFLSGGVDSSGIVALMAHNSSKPIRTFTITFKEKTHNEAEYAANIARRYHTEHTEIPTEIKDIDMLPDLIKHFESPFSDSSIIITYLVCQAARKYVTVALNGDGGDENFAGYPNYNAWLFTNRLPKTFINILKFGRFFERFIPNPSRRYQFNVLLDAFNKEKPQMYLDFFSSTYFIVPNKLKLYTDDFKKMVRESSYKKAKEYFNTKLDLLSQALDFGIKTYLPEDLLVKVDIASMANAIEGRSPLLDQEFLELTAKIPASLKIKNNQNKYIFKKALEGFLPDEILTKRKQGFSIPIDKWMREDLNKFAKRIILSGKAVKRNIFKNQFVA